MNIPVFRRRRPETGFDLHCVAGHVVPSVWVAPMTIQNYEKNRMYRYSITMIFSFVR